MYCNHAIELSHSWNKLKLKHYKTNVEVTQVWKDFNCTLECCHVIYIYINYTLYKNAEFWLVNSRDIFKKIQALHCEFAESLFHVGVFA